MQPTFSSIGGRLHLSASLSDMSGRDKVQLFQALMEQLGITQRLHEEPDQTARAQEILVEQWNKHWG